MLKALDDSRWTPCGPPVQMIVLRPRPGRTPTECVLLGFGPTSLSMMDAALLTQALVGDRKPSSTG